MRHLVFILFCSVVFAQAQKNQEQNAVVATKILVDENDLTPEQLAKIKLKQKLQTYGDTARWGHEIGVAVNETLAAVTENTAKFAKTDVGKVAMFLVAWKVMANDVMIVGDKLIQYIVGIPFLVIGLTVVVWSYRRQCVPRRVLVEKGQGFWLWRSKKYEIYDPSAQQGNLQQDDWVACHAVVAAVIVIVGSLMIFSG